MVRCFTQGLATKSLNTCVTGFLRRKRIVFWNTARQTLDDDELPPGLWHELGHYVLGHTVKSIALSAIVVFIALHAAHRWVGRAIGRFKERLELSALSDFAGLPLVIRPVNLLSLVAATVEPTFSRQQEHEADRFVLDHAQPPRRPGFSETTTAQPKQPATGEDPYTLAFRSHPSSGGWIDFCNRYRPWETGEPSRDEKFIKF